MRIGEYDLEPRFDRLRARSSTDIEEVRRLSPRQFDNVHRPHRQSRAVDHAADVPLELDVVQIRLRGLDLERILLVEVAEQLQFGVPFEGVVVKVHFRIERQDPSVLRDHERIDFGKRAIHCLVGSIQRRKEFDAVPERITAEPQGKGQRARLKGMQPRGPFHRFAEDLSGRFGGHLFNLHSSLRGRHHDIP